MHAVAVEVQHAARAVARSREGGAHLQLERLPGQQRGGRVEVVLQHGAGLARQQLGQALGAQVEVLGVGRAEHREEPGDAAGGVAHGDREDLVGWQAALGGVRLVDEQRPPLQLRPVQQVAVGRRQDADLGLGAGPGLAHRHVAFRDHERAEHAAEVVHAGLHQEAEFVGFLGVLGVVGGDLQQQVEVAVAGVEVATEAAEGGPGDQFPLQALEHRLHQLQQERVGPGLAVAGHQRRHADDLPEVVMHPERVGGCAFEIAGESVNYGGCGCRRPGDRLFDHRLRVGTVIVIRHPQRHSVAVVEADARSPGHQHADQVPVRVQRRPGTSEMLWK